MAVGHKVDVYDDREALVMRIADLLRGALDEGGAAIALARAELLDAITRALTAAGRDVADLRARGRLALLDAEHAIAAISTDETIDGAKFRARIGDAVQCARGVARDAPVHIYGEAVDVLWERGRRDAVIELERLWSELGREHHFLLVCGYDLRRFSERDTDSLARLCGLHDDQDPTNLAALQQRARALEIEIRRRERLEQRMHRLLAVSAELSAARTEGAIARLAIEEGRAAVGAASSTLWLRDGDNMHVAAHSSSVPGDLEPYRTIPIGFDAPLAEVARTGEPIFIGSFAEYERRFPTSWARIKVMITGDHALAMLPLVGTLEPLGVICFTYDQPRTFEGPDKAFKAVLARQCALAIENVRLQAAERARRHEAEEAIRAREEILSVVSHDLRNPLGTIMLAASTLLSLDAAEKPHRVRPIAERVHRQAERMARLIEDLVDFAGIQAGRLAMRRGLHAPEAIVNEARELFGPIAEERGLAFEAKLPSGLPHIECDSERVVQLISNLVSNALKVTPKGGKIAIGVEPKEREVVFFVRDTGPGIDPEELPNVFERFWRSKRASYKGAGLGLSIARGIVDAHGGRIWAESQLGVGSTFYFSLYSQQN